MKTLKSNNRLWYFWGIWGVIMALLVTGFLKPLLRLPVMGVMRFHECHGFNVASAVICLLGVGVGGVLWILSQRRAYTAVALGVSGVGLLSLLTCFFRLGSYLREMLEALSTEGMDLSRVIQPGGWSLLSGLVIGLTTWILGLVQFAKNRTKNKDLYES